MEPTKYPDFFRFLLGEIKSKDWDREQDETALGNVFIKSSDIKIKHSREVYTIFTLMGDIGGMLGVMTYVLSFILGPITEHSFTMKALEKLYFVKTDLPNMFRKSSTFDKNALKSKEEPTAT